MDILCSDKTGTLTQNRLTLSEPATFGDVDAQQVVLMGALASKEEDQDSIDLAVIQGLKDPKILKGYQQEKFVPFDPVAKRTEANVKGPDGRAFRVSKGAPQVIKELCRCDSALQSKIEVEVDRFAEKGNRTLGVARSDDGEHWIFLGLLPLYDPPREDARDTIARAEAHGIHVKMITGDNDAIACEIARQLGMDSNIQVAGDFLKSAGEDETPGKEVIDHVEQAAGFAQVFPEHKYAIVKALQAGGHIVGMTGDGVNDAPALKQAEVGTAVSGATDAARAAADLVLTAPGLSVIVGAVEEARKIFERMNSYAIYRIVETLRIMFFVTLAMTVYNLFPITAVMIILLALLNDLPIMSIAYDNTWLDPLPVRWNMRRVLTVATVLGTIGVVETFLLLVIAKTWFGLEGAQLQSIIFLKLAVAGHLTLFVARTHRPFYAKPHPAPILLVAILSTQTVAAMIVGFGWLVASIPWYYVGLIWLYCLVWIFIEDLAKLRVYKYFGLETDT